MVSDPFEWERKWPRYDEYLILDGSLDSRVQVDECPRCAAIVRTENRLKHEAVCWGPEEEVREPTNPFPSTRANADRLLSDYAVMVRRLLQEAPELGEHRLHDYGTWDGDKHIARTTFYGKDFLVTIERVVEGG